MEKNKEIMTPTTAKPRNEPTPRNDKQQCPETTLQDLPLAKITHTTWPTPQNQWPQMDNQWAVLCRKGSQSWASDSGPLPECLVTKQTQSILDSHAQSLVQKSRVFWPTNPRILLQPGFPSGFHQRILTNIVPSWKLWKLRAPWRFTPTACSGFCVSTLVILRCFRFTCTWIEVLKPAVAMLEYQVPKLKQRRQSNLLVRRETAWLRLKTWHHMTSHLESRFLPKTWNPSPM